MPEDTFLQQFHNLAHADGEVRCKAAVAVRQTLSRDDGAVDQENLQYTIKRLVRGVQSSRQCARQGFSLALAEVLTAFPHELPGVVALIAELTALQTGLKASEQKDRLLGRLFAYAAIFNSGCFHTDAGEVAKKTLSEMGTGLHEMFVARNYLRGPSSRLLVEICRHLCSTGRPEEVADVLSAWSLDSKVKGGKKEKSETGESHVFGIVLELRLCFEQLEKSGTATASLRGWPECVKKDHVAQAGVLENLAQALATEMSGAPLTDAPPFALDPLCRWWLQEADTRQPGQLQARILASLDTTLFPEKASANTQVQGLRAFAELANHVSSAASSLNSKEKGAVEGQVVGLFERMPRGLALMLRMLTIPRSPQHAAAVFGHEALVTCLGAEPAKAAAGKKRGADGACKEEAPAAKAHPKSQLSLSDGARLSVLSVLQKHRSFGTMGNCFQRPWHQALLTPLSPAGVRERCAALIAGLRAPAATDAERPSARVMAVQLEQLTLHSKAPDEVILAVLFLLFGAAYFAPGEGGEGDASAGCSLKAFCTSVGLSSILSGDEIIIPASPACGEQPSKEDRQAWQSKFWSTLSGLVRRPLPDVSEKVLAAAGSDVEGEDGEGPGSLVRSKALHGCLSDGTLLVLRLHQWWDFATTARAEDAAPPKKKRKSGAEAASAAASLRYVGKLSESDQALRSRSVAMAVQLLALDDEAQTLSSRQKNALANLSLCMSLSLMNAQQKDEKALIRDNLNELLPKIDMVMSIIEGKAKKKKKTLNEAIAIVPRLSAELFVMSTGLVKEAAKSAWREFSDYIPEETLDSLCGAIKDEEAKDESDGEGSDGESDGEDDVPANTAANAAKAAAFDRATAALKAQREAEAAEAGEKGEEAGSDDEVALDGMGMLEQLLGDDDDEDQGAPSNSLLTSFAGSGLQEATAGSAVKLTKRQQRLKQRQEDFNRKFCELDLLESFLQRHVDKKPKGIEILRDLHEVLIVSLRRATGGGKDGAEGENSKAGEKGKKSKADNSMKQLQMALALRVAKLLTRCLRQVCKPSSVQKVCGYKTAEEWEEHAQAMLASGFTARVAAAGGRPLQVGASMLYLFCAAHHAAAGPEDQWALAEKLLKGALGDWSGKKDGDKWCDSIFRAFAVRVPDVLLRLPWVEQIRASGARRAFVQRAQVSFLANELLSQNLNFAASGPVAVDFADLCAEMLESTVGAQKADGDAASNAQKQKLRREALRGLKVALKVRKRGGQVPVLPAKRAERVSAAVARTRDALPARHGEVYQLCLHVLRSTSADAKDSKDSKDGKQEAGVKRAAPASEEPAANAKKRKASETSEAAAPGKTAPSVKGGPKVAKGNKQFYKDM